MTTKKRSPGRPFPKGTSGNPGGRAKMPEEVKQALRDLTPVAVEKLGQLLKRGSPKLRLAAAKEVLDRVLGKSSQPIELTGKDGGPVEVSDARERLAARLAALLEQQPAGGGPSDAE